MERGKKRPNVRGAEDADARGRKMQKQGGGESRYLGRRKQILGGSRIRCFGRAESGGKGVKWGKVGSEAVDSPWGVGEVCRGGVKNFSPFVSI